MSDFNFTVKQTVSDERVKDLVITAFEGGSNYWYLILGYEGDTAGVEFKHCDMPFKEGGAVIVCDKHEEYEVGEENVKRHKLNRESIQRGLEVMAEKYPRHMADFLKEQDDADTGDVFLQCCLFGEVIFG